ncbi:Tat proofreading chaperone DmsD [Lelliottia sp. CFBP8978]|uniref:Tat proofreading chaperone DmsD n=1 Tax=Lelliottia sp. CFBP8978 TaxID=3096522 RepID=UPI002A69C453|nr:Tat proofreading chaperone DmsD [Lelliottia sp. CFBP8978]MDY1035821.1 Tat proofreading chaperone DmsD [Lelliottia sp. CFBP8978]
MNDVSRRDSFAFSARVLGALFYFAPDSPQAAPLVTALTTTDWYQDWPLEQSDLLAIANTMRETTDEPLPDAWQRLFIGPWALPAPPWGSVWLDRESVLFGDSTLALRQWMRDNSIAFEMQQNEPEDHFGTLLLLAAWLAENGRHAECDQLLAWHLLPWSQRFLSVFAQEANHPFYRALGQLALLTLADWQSSLLIPVAEKPLHR